MKKFSKAFLKTIKILTVLYMIFTIIIFIKSFIPIYIVEASNIKLIMRYIPLHILISFGISFIMVTFFCAPLIQLYFMFKIGNKVVDTIDSSQHKKINKNIYYRDIPTDYNPAIASLILNKWFEKKIDITTMILYLIKKGYLKKEGNIVIYTGKNIDDLPMSERYIVEHYKNKELEFYFFRWRNIVIQEAIDKGYAESIETQYLNAADIEDNNKEIFKKLQKKFSIVIILVFLFIIFLISIDLVILLIPIFTIGIPIGIFSLIIYAYRRTLVSIKLTDKGIEEQEKLVKLRRFLQDFSNLKEYNEEALSLWEDYLIYAISLGVNTDIVEQSKIYNELDNDKFTINKDLLKDVETEVNNRIKFNEDNKNSYNMRY